MANPLLIAQLTECAETLCSLGLTKPPLRRPAKKPTTGHKRKHDELENLLNGHKDTLDAYIVQLLCALSVPGTHDDVWGLLRLREKDYQGEGERANLVHIMQRLRCILAALTRAQEGPPIKGCVMNRVSTEMREKTAQLARASEELGHWARSSFKEMQGTEDGSHPYMTQDAGGLKIVAALWQKKEPDLEKAVLEVTELKEGISNLDTLKEWLGSIGA